MAGRLSGKRAFVTAAGQGIGRATVEAFVREGAEVIATDINQAALDELGALNGVTARHLDVMSGTAVKAAAQEAGKVDILFNCAGFVHNGTILDCTETDWDFSFDLNVKSQYRMISAFLPGMIEAGGASIINMSSVASSVIAAPNRFVYGASKAAVIGLTKSVAADFVTQGIRCNAVCPGTVQSPSLDDRLTATGDYQAARSAFIARQPMGRIAEASEIANLVVYLGSDEAAFVTGTAFPIDGGWSNV